jgi:hypothetical protein
VVSLGGGTFATWPYRPSKLSKFIDHIKSIYGNIQFTMETERDGHLPFLFVENLS